MPAEGMLGRSHTRDRSGVPATETGLGMLLRDRKKSRGNPGPMSLAGFEYVCGMFGHAERAVEDLEGKWRSRRWASRVVPRCKCMPTGIIGRPLHLAVMMACSSKKIMRL